MYGFRRELNMDITGAILILICVLICVTNGMAIFCNAKYGTPKQQIMEARMKMWKSKIEHIARHS